MKSRPQVIVAMSGGVDSTVAAFLLKEQGFDVTGVTMALYDPSFPVTPSRNSCFSPEEKDTIIKTKAICQSMGIPHHVIDLKKEFRTHVLDYFTHEYGAGRTPNPCVQCNRHLKFGSLFKKAAALIQKDDAFFATGHYVRVEKDPATSLYLMRKAAFLGKDQSYFLYGIDSRLLPRLLFPLGDSINKDHVKAIARSFGYPVDSTKESQDFLSTEDYSPFFATIDNKPGDITDENGRKLGTHKGIAYYTVGQRRGLGIAAPTPLYVLSIDAHANTITVGQKNRLLSLEALADDVNILAPGYLNFPFQGTAKIRHAHQPAGCTVFLEDGRLRVVFATPQLSITPGQSIVVYKDDIVIGGGTIRSNISSHTS